MARMSIYVVQFWDGDMLRSAAFEDLDKAAELFRQFLTEMENEWGIAGQYEDLAAEVQDGNWTGGTTVIMAGEGQNDDGILQDVQAWVSATKTQLRLG